MTQILHIQMILSFVKIKASFLFCTPPFPFPPFPSPSPPPIIRRATPVYTIRDLWHDILYYYRGNCSQVVLYRAITFLTPIIFIVFTLILFEWRHFHRHPPIPHTHIPVHTSVFVFNIHVDYYPEILWKCVEIIWCQILDVLSHHLKKLIYIAKGITRLFLYDTYR